MTPGTIYKLLPREDWEAAQHMGVYRGSAHDNRDGFIHFSTAAQLTGTARKYFAAVEDLLLLAVDAGACGEALCWEPSRGGDLFPHLYADLPISAVTSAVAIPLGPDAIPVLPGGLAP